MQTYTQYMKEQDSLQAEEARFEQLCEEYEADLESMKPSAVESFKEWLYGQWFAGKLAVDNNATQGLWAEYEAEKQMKRDREARE